MVVEIVGQFLQTEISSHFLLCNVNLTSEPGPGVLDMGTEQGEQNSARSDWFASAILPYFPNS